MYRITVLTAQSYPSPHNADVAAPENRHAGSTGEGEWIRRLWRANRILIASAMVIKNGLCSGSPQTCTSNFSRTSLRKGGREVAARRDRIWHTPLLMNSHPLLHHPHCFLFNSCLPLGPTTTTIAYSIYLSGSVALAFLAGNRIGA